MKKYSVHPVFDADHTLKIEAESEVEAACKFYGLCPVSKDLFVSSSSWNEQIVKIQEVLEAYPEMAVTLSIPESESGDNEAFAGLEEEFESEKYSHIGGWLWLLAIQLVAFPIVKIKSLIAAFSLVKGIDWVLLKHGFPVIHFSGI